MLSWIKNNQNWWKENSWYFAVCLPPCHSARSRRRSRRILDQSINIFLRKEIICHFLKQWILQLRASPSFRMTGGWVERLEEESSSIKCAATNFKNKLTLFFLKDMNQLKTNFHSINPNPIDTSINNQQENLHSITNSQSIIPKTIGTGLIQNRCKQHQPNQSTWHQISFQFIFLVRKLLLFAVRLPPCHSAWSWRRSRRIYNQNVNHSNNLLFKGIGFFGIGVNRP